MEQGLDAAFSARRVRVPAPSRQAHRGHRGGAVRSRGGPAPKLARTAPPDPSAQFPAWEADRYRLWVSAGIVHRGPGVVRTRDRGRDGGEGSAVITTQSIAGCPATSRHE